MKKTVLILLLLSMIFSFMPAYADPSQDVIDTMVSRYNSLAEDYQAEKLDTSLMVTSDNAAIFFQTGYYVYFVLTKTKLCWRLYI